MARLAPNLRRLNAKVSRDADVSRAGDVERGRVDVGRGLDGTACPGTGGQLAPSSRVGAKSGGERTERVDHDFIFVERENTVREKSMKEKVK